MTNPPITSPSVTWPLCRLWILASAAAAVCFPVSAGGAGDAKATGDTRQTASFKRAVLRQFDLNGNGRLDPKELSAATRALASADESDPALAALREQALARFDKNGNGILDRSEIRTALASVNAKPRVGRRVPFGNESAASRSVAQRSPGSPPADGGSWAAIDFATRRVMATTGLDAASAETLVIQSFDADGNGVLDASELAAAQTLISQQLAQSAALQQSVSTTALSGSGATGSISSGVGSTGTTSTASSSGSMSGGCGSGGGGGGGGVAAAPGVRGFGGGFSFGRGR